MYFEPAVIAGFVTTAGSKLDSREHGVARVQHTVGCGVDDVAATERFA
jgi:hypothetical protein